MLLVLDPHDGQRLALPTQDRQRSTRSLLHQFELAGELDQNFRPQFAHSIGWVNHSAYFESFGLSRIRYGVGAVSPLSSWGTIRGPTAPRRAFVEGLRRVAAISLAGSRPSQETRVSRRSVPSGPPEAVPTETPGRGLPCPPLFKLTLIDLTYE